MSTVKVGFVAVATLLGAGFGASACLDRPLCDKDCTPRTTNIFVDTIAQKTVDKIDLLFMIDNSISMADKQAVLKDAVPDLVRRLVSPNCVAADGTPDVAGTPPNPSAPCPTGKEREFTPIRNIHIGVITSSLGGHGAKSCDGTSAPPSGEQENDKGHLIATRPRFPAELAKSPGAQPADPSGFLDWNPANRPGGTQDIGPFNATFQAMVGATSEFGCGYEAQLEAIYRFLIDPKPYERIDVAPCSATNTADCAFPTGVDQNVLNQRKEFLRPDSLVAIIMVTDENDCSIIEKQQGYYAARADDIDLPRATRECVANPNDACCRSCISGNPPGCQPDPACAEGGGATPDDLDPPNLRCFNQKRRFGLDFLYPTARYVNALKQTQLCTSAGDLAVDPANPGACRDEDGVAGPDIARNPLYDDLKGTGALPRDSSLVFFAGIIGVPWQDIKADKNAKGDITYPAGELHYKVFEQLQAENTWDVILGNPNPPNGAGPIPPRNTLMVESIQQRGGNDGQGAPLAPPSSPALANPVNSHEWGNTRKDDLMYACVFPLKTPRDCAEIATRPEPRPGCDCTDVKPNDGEFNPLCQNPQGNAYGKTQYFAKAYPGLRELQVLKDYGKNSIVASICARNLTDPNAQDYGYGPAVDAIVDRLKEALTGRCLPRTLEPDDQGNVPCSILEVRPIGTSCDESRNRKNADAEIVDAARARLQQEGSCGGGGGQPSCSQFVFCQLLDAGPDCHKTVEQKIPGWCYVDPDQNPNVDDPALVEKCPANEKRIIRFVGERTPEPDAKVLIACFGASTNKSEMTAMP